uniref:Ig-like domain-containing protein n=1 Tax=Acanthochromis polyacanthus TaxID=80966 RepID=A0A3Q1F2A8_9TELE
RPNQLLVFKVKLIISPLVEKFVLQTFATKQAAADGLKENVHGLESSIAKEDSKSSTSGCFYTDQLHCDSSGSYEAYFGGGTKLTVLDPDRQITPPKVKIFRPSPKECKNQKEEQRKKTLVCVASDFYPDHVTVSWKLNGEDVSTGVATDSAATPVDKSYRITSRLKISATLWENQDNSFVCIVSFFDGDTTIYRNDTLDVKGLFFRKLILVLV